MPTRPIVPEHARLCSHRSTNDMPAAPRIRRRDQAEDGRTGSESPDLRSRGLALDRPDEPIRVIAAVRQAVEDPRERRFVE